MSVNRPSGPFNTSQAQVTILFLAFVWNPDGLDYALVGQQLDLVCALIAALDRFCGQNLGVVLFCGLPCGLIQLDRKRGRRQADDQYRQAQDM